MPRDELEEIMSNGFKGVGMKIEAEALIEISGLSKGLPHYAHLLSLHAGRSAIDAKSLRVGLQNVKAAIKLAISGAQESIRNMYDKATYSTKKNALHKQVLLACSMTDADERGNFSPAQVEKPMTIVMGKKYTSSILPDTFTPFARPTAGQFSKRRDSPTASVIAS
jgi:hypothetical protein